MARRRQGVRERATGPSLQLSLLIALVLVFTVVAGVVLLFTLKWHVLGMPISPQTWSGQASLPIARRGQSSPSLAVTAAQLGVNLTADDARCGRQYLNRNMREPWASAIPLEYCEPSHVLLSRFYTVVFMRRGSNATAVLDDHIAALNKQLGVIAPIAFTNVFSVDMDFAMCDGQFAARFTGYWLPTAADALTCHSYTASLRRNGGSVSSRRSSVDVTALGLPTAISLDATAGIVAALPPSASDGCTQAILDVTFPALNDTDPLLDDVYAAYPNASRNYVHLRWLSADSWCADDRILGVSFNTAYDPDSTFCNIPRALRNDAPAMNSLHWGLVTRSKPKRSHERRQQAASPALLPSCSDAALPNTACATCLKTGLSTCSGSPGRELDAHHPWDVRLPWDSPAARDPRTSWFFESYMDVSGRWGMGLNLAWLGLGLSSFYPESEVATRKDVVLVIADDPVETTHVDLSGDGRYNASLAYDCFSLSSDMLPPTRGPCPGPAECHGTAVAGLAVAASNDVGTTGVSGVGGRWTQTVIDHPQRSSPCICRACIAEAVSQSASARGYTYGVISISAGFPQRDIFSQSPQPSNASCVSAYNDAFDMLKSANWYKGRAVVFAAGNNGPTVDVGFDLPLNQHTSIPITAITGEGLLMGHDGKEGGGQHGAAIVAAALTTAVNCIAAWWPSNRPSTVPCTVTTDLTEVGPPVTIPRNGYTMNEYNLAARGTSFAAPLVSGLFHLIMANRPSMLGYIDLLGILIESCTFDGVDTTGYDSTLAHTRRRDRSNRLPPYMHNIYFGFGRVRAHVAVQKASQWAPVTVYSTLLAGPTSSWETVNDQTLHSRLTVESDNPFSGGWYKSVAHVRVCVTSNALPGADVDQGFNMNLRSPDGF